MATLWIPPGPTTAAPTQRMGVCWCCGTKHSDTAATNFICLNLRYGPAPGTPCGSRIFIAADPT